MKSTLFLLLASSCIFVAACDSQGNPVSLQRLNEESNSFAYNSGLNESEEIVIRDESALTEVWARIHASRSPQPELPEVDFDKNVVLVVALGERPTGGYSITFNAAFVSGNDITVHVQATSPGAGCGVTTAVTQPIDIALLARTDARIEFQRRETVHDC